MGKEKRKKRKARKFIPYAVVYISSTFNNTIITFTDQNGGVLCWGSGGTAGFKGTRKSTPFAAQKAMTQVSEKAKRFGIHEVDVKIKGPGPGKEAAIRALQVAGFDILSIEDTTPIPHNGCRPKKKRSV
jgi:small subunit ribosomal protein S11